jgi:HlyD family secretion protein
VVNTRAGSVKACRRAALSPAVGGQIATWPVDEGMKVKKGDLLLSLWNEDLQAQLDLAQSEAEAAQANSQATCLQAKIAERQLNRYLPLQDKGATTEELLDKLSTDLGVTKAQCEAAQSTLKVSRSRIALAKANLERTLLHAPFDGTIAQLNGELGEYVTPSPVGVQTLPAVDLIDVSCFYVSAPIDEVDVAAIRVGMDARISLDAYQDRHFAGKVKRIADYVLDLEKQARTIEIEVGFGNPADMANLLPGYSADAEIILQVKKNILRVPTEAILDKNKIFIFDPDRQVLVERKISTGITNWDFSEILSGLEAGELVVTTSDRKGLQDGAPAKVEAVAHD